MTISLIDYAVPSVRLPILHYGYMPGCPGCAKMTPIVDRVVEASRGTIELRKYDVTVPGQVFPMPAETVPVLALEIQGVGFFKAKMPTERYPEDVEVNGWVWRTFNRVRRGELR